ncbi:SH3 domain-containing protein [Shewanella maritima]|uniref:SH3 domain-containing protein n=1 Tax=Shewanella maritima TaxID=2520507 RepID=UPI003736870A
MTAIKRIIFISFLMICSQTACAETIDITISAPYIELHSGPSAGYPIVHVIEKNEQVTVLLKRTSWLKVRDKRGVEGWFHEDKLTGFSLAGETVVDEQTNKYHYPERDYEFGVFYGDLEGANYYSLYGDYAFTDVFSVEISTAKAFGKISDSDVYQGMFYAQPRPDWTVIPYIGVGGGMIKINPHSVIADSQSRQHTLMSAAAGLKYHLARNFIVRAEYQLSLALTDRDENEEIETWKIGFSVFF